MDKSKLKVAVLSAIMAMIVQLLFLGIFGRETALVGVMMVLAALSLMKSDLTLYPVSKIGDLLFLNLILGIISYIITINLYVGIILNFSVIFLVNYIYMNEFKSPTSYIFIMIYIIMWGNKISINKLPNRLLALSFGVGIIMALQFMVNRNSFRSKSRLLTQDAIEDVVKEVNDIIEDKYNNTENIILAKRIRSLFQLINESNRKKFYSSTEHKLIFNIAISIERVNLIIRNIPKKNNKKLLEELKAILIFMKKLLESKYSIQDIELEFQNFIEKYKDGEESYVIELLEVIFILKHNLLNLADSEDEYLREINSHYELPKQFSLKGKIKRNHNFDSLILKHSLKMAIVLSGSMFICDRLNLVYGKWIVLTAYVIMQPYVEDSIIKSKKKIKGTVLGVIVFLIALIIFKESLPKQILIFIALICYFYFKEYDRKVINLTIISLTSISMNDKIYFLSFEKIIYMIIGILMVLIVNKYLLPYNIRDSIRDLKAKYNRLINLLKEEIIQFRDDKEHKEAIIKLILLCNEVEDKLIVNNRRINDEDLEKFIIEKSVVMSDIRFLILQIYYMNKGCLKNGELNIKIINSLNDKIE